jgi:hypothetical protein
MFAQEIRSGNTGHANMEILDESWIFGADNILSGLHSVNANVEVIVILPFA